MLSKEDAERLLRSARRDIDDIDREMLRWLATRMHRSQDIGRCKRQLGMEVVQPEVAERRLKFLLDYGEMVGLDADFIRRYWEVLHAESCRQQQPQNGTL